MGRELVSDFRPALRMREHVAARDVDLVGQRKGHGVSGLGALDLLVRDENARDRGAAAGSGDDDRVAASYPAARNRARKAAKIEMRAVDPLNRETKRRRSPIFFASVSD